MIICFESGLCMVEKTCCFFGHRNVEETEELIGNVYNIVEKLITEENVTEFLFGSRSDFYSVCHKAVSRAKEKYPFINRIYIRAEYPYIDNDYENRILRHYEKTCFPKRIIGAGKAIYTERNCEMIKQSRFCVIYYNESTAAKNSGTKAALKYAQKLEKQIIIV